MTAIRKLILGSAASVTALGFAAGAALASGPVVYNEPEVMVAPMPAPALSWAGLYGGLSYSRVSGGVTDPAGLPDLESDNGFGAFVGYNWQRGGFVFGGELNYTNFDTSFVGFPGTYQRDSLDLRARAGYAFNRVMVYGFVGAARSTIGSGGTDFTQTGPVYGLGVEAMVTSNMSVGLEFARRNVDADVLGTTVESELDTVSLRAAYHF
ncbi:outer membrane protein [Pararhodobacter zhoushanensis]|uniref:Porin family protein n=1 Tax=Pararhodobacter zhoushanensis TaxID=2479545 RepID=A0ABT3GUA6_9RHOB|nr:porin family protein [Pararhodobacter zhoushanensis]MCW1931118.1 porin family protein [Pararhodobacter zhoushanensis]